MLYYKDSVKHRRGLDCVFVHAYLHICCAYVIKQIFPQTSCTPHQVLNHKWFYKRKIFYGQVLPFCTLVSISIYNKHYDSDLLSRLAACQRIPAFFVLPSNQNRAPCLSGVGSSNVALLLENSQRPDLAQKNFR